MSLHLLQDRHSRSGCLGIGLTSFVVVVVVVVVAVVVVVVVVVLCFISTTACIACTKSRIRISYSNTTHLEMSSLAFVGCGIL